MNNKHKASKTVLSVLSGIFALLTLFFFIQIVVKANTPITESISSEIDSYDKNQTDDNNSYNEEADEFDSEDDEDDTDYSDIDFDELSDNFDEYVYEHYSDMVNIHGRQIGAAKCSLNKDNTPEILFSNYPEGVDFDCFIDIITIEDNDLNKIDTITGRFEAYQGDNCVYLIGKDNGKYLYYRINLTGNKLSKESLTKKDIPKSCYDIPIEFEDITNDLKVDNESLDNEVNSKEIDEAYYDLLNDYYDENLDGTDAFASSAVYDINDDGVVEAIIQYSSGGESQLEIYSYADDSFEFVDSVVGDYSIYAAEDGDGLFLVSGRQGVQRIDRLTMNAESSEVYTDEYSTDQIDFDSGEEYYSNDEPVDLSDIRTQLGH